MQKSILFSAYNFRIDKRSCTFKFFLLYCKNVVMVNLIVNLLKKYPAGNRNWNKAYFIIYIFLGFYYDLLLIFN